MSQVESKVRRARRRLVLGNFGKAVCITTFAGLLIATIAIAIPALYAVPIDFHTWVYAWLGGCLLAALLSAVAYAWFTSPSVASVATEIDRRFGLKERLSSSMSLDEQDRASDFGIALMADAEKRASQLNVADRFSLKLSRLGLLPISIVPILALVLILVEPSNESSASSQSASNSVEAQQVKTAASQLKKRIQQQRRKAEAEGLTEARELFEKMEAELDKVASKQEMNRKEAMIAMNDLKKQLEERRDQLGSSEQMRRAMSQMKGLESGPGEKVAKSMEKGDFGQAQEMAKQLASKMRDGELSEQDKQQLAKQVEQMKKAMEQAVQAHEQQKKNLQQQIEQARKDGRSEEASKMQEQLNQLQQKDAQMEQMGQMAEAMSKAAQAMQRGDTAEAADAMEQLADQLGEMQQEMSELEDLQSALDQLSQSKNQMRCEKCGGGGCQQCQGDGMGQGQGQGSGLGEGSGFGDRPEQEEDTNTYETQVRGDVKQGKAVIAGFADGPNRKGVTREDVKQAIDSSLREESDPAENQTLPRTEREHAQQYFDQLREGK